MAEQNQDRVVQPDVERESTEVATNAADKARNETSERGVTGTASDTLGPKVEGGNWLSPQDITPASVESMTRAQQAATLAANEKQIELVKKEMERIQQKVAGFSKQF
jgi:hypothetical protein